MNLKTNQQLTQNPELNYQQNKILKDAINDREIYFENVIDQYSHPTKTDLTATYNKKSPKNYHECENKARNSEKVSDESSIKEIEKLEQEIKDIQKSTNDLIRKFYESGKKNFDYQILLSLDSRLTTINRVFTNEAKNSISSNPQFISSSRLNKLQQEVEIKEELSSQSEELEATEYALKSFTEKLDYCVSIINQILLINKKRKNNLDKSGIAKNSLEKEGTIMRSTKSDKINNSEKNIKSEESNKLKQNKKDETAELLEKEEEALQAFDNASNQNKKQKQSKKKHSKKEGHAHKPILEDKANNTQIKNSDKNNSPQLQSNSPSNLQPPGKNHIREEVSEYEYSESETDNVSEKVSLFEKSEKVEQNQPQVDTLHSPIVHPITKEEREDIDRIFESESETEYAQLVPEEQPNKYGNKKSSSNAQRPIDRKSSNNEKPKTKEKVALTKPPIDKPHTAKTVKTGGKIDIKCFEKARDESDSDSEYVLLDIKEQPGRSIQVISRQSGKSSKSENTKISKQNEKQDPQKQPARPPYLHSALPSKSRGESQTANKQQSTEVLECILTLPEEEPKEQSEHVIECSESSCSEKLIVTEKFLLCNIQAQQNMNPEQSENHEITKPPTSKPCSLLTHTNNQEKADIQHNEKVLDELESKPVTPEIHSENLNKPVNNGVSNNSVKPISTKSGSEVKLKPRQNEEMMKTQTSTLFSHPFLKQGKTDEQYYEKIQSGSEYTSEYILREPEEQTTKTTKTTKTNQPNQPNKTGNTTNTKISKANDKQDPQTQPIRSPYLHPSQPTKSRQESLAVNKQQSTEVLECILTLPEEEPKEQSEHVIECSESSCSEKLIVTEKFLLCNIQAQQNMNPEQPSDTTEPLIPINSKPKPITIQYQKENSTQKEIQFDDPEQPENNKITKPPKSKPITPVNNDISNDSVKPISTKTSNNEKSNPRQNAEMMKPPARTPCSLFSHPFLKQGKKDEQYYEKIQSGSEYTSEYILREPEEQTTKPNKSLNAGNNKAPKDKEKLSPQKQPVRSPYLHPAHPNKSRQEPQAVNNQQSTEVLECVLTLPDEEIQQPNNTVNQDNSFKSNQPKEFTKSKPTEKAESPKTSENTNHPPLTHHTANQGKVDMQCTPEYILKESEAQAKKSKQVENARISINPKKPADPRPLNDPTKSKQTENNEPPKPPVSIPYSYLAHPNKSRQKPFTNHSKKSTEEPSHIIAQQKEKTEKTGNLANNDSPKPLHRSPYIHSALPSNSRQESLTVNHQQSREVECVLSLPKEEEPNQCDHPNKDQGKADMKYYEKVRDESECTSEYILKDPEEKARKSNKQEKSIPSNQSNQLQIKNIETPKSPVDAPYSLLVHPGNIVQQPNIANIQKSTDESEYETEYTEEQSDNLNTIEQQEAAISSDRSLYSSQSGIDMKRKTQYSLLSRPNKNRQLSFTMHDQANGGDEFERSAEYIVLKPEEPMSPDRWNKSESPEFASSSEKIFFSSQSNICNQTENIESPRSPIKSPYSLLFQPTKKRQQESSDEFGQSSEYILIKPEEPMSPDRWNRSDSPEFASSSEKLFYSSQSNIFNQPETPRSPIKSPFSLLIQPAKIRQQLLPVGNQQGTDESEQTSEFVLEGFDEKESEKPIVTRNLPVSNTRAQRNTEPKEAENAEQSARTQYSLLSRPNKNRQQSFTMHDQANGGDEFERSAEYIVLKPEEPMSPDRWNKSESPEFASSSEKIFFSSQLNICNQPENIESPRSPIKAYSLVFQPSKSRQQQFSKNDQQSPEVLECILTLPEEEPKEQSEHVIECSESSCSEKLIVTEKFLLCNIQAQQNMKSEQPENHEITKPSANKPIKPVNNGVSNDSVKPISTKSGSDVKLKPRQNEEMMKTQTSTLFSHPFLKQGKTDEQYYEKIQSGSEYTSEYILREPEEQTTKTTKTTKTNQPNQPNKTGNTTNTKISKANEKQDPQTQPIRSPYLHPSQSNKSRQESRTVNKQQSTEALECVLTFPEEEPGQPNNSANQENYKKTEKSALHNQANKLTKVESQKPPENNNCSPLTRPNKSQEKACMQDYDGVLSGSEYTSEFILKEPEEQTSKPSETRNTKNSKEAVNNDQQKPSYRSPYLHPSHPNKCRQQTSKLNYQQSREVIECILSLLEEETKQPTSLSNKENSKKSEKLKPKTNQLNDPIRPKPTEKVEMQSNKRVLNGSEFILKEPEEPTTKFNIPKNTENMKISRAREKLDPQKPAARSLYLHSALPSKSRGESQAVNKQQSTEVLECILTLPEEEPKEQSEHVIECSESSCSEKLIVTEKFLLCNIQAQQNMNPEQPSDTTEPLIPINSKPKPITIQYQKENSTKKEIPLDDPKKEAKKHEPQPNINNLVVSTPNNMNKKKPPPKKKPFISTYDPSIFYTSFKDVKKSTFKCTDPVPLTVSLKDIGLEGLDSCHLELQRNNSKIIVCVNDFAAKNREKIETFPNAEVVCKLIVYERKDKINSSKKKLEQTTTDSDNCAALNPKPPSLLDSTQKAQKTQAIKPKMLQKSMSKMNKSGSNIHDETQLNSSFYRSPRRHDGAKNQSDEKKNVWNTMK